MSKRLLFSIIFAATVVVGWAQNDDGNKLSVTTQMFLQELNGEISFEQNEELIKASAKAKVFPWPMPSDEPSMTAPLRNQWKSTEGNSSLPSFA